MRVSASKPTTLMPSSNPATASKKKKRNKKNNKPIIEDKKEEVPKVQIETKRTSYTLEEKLMSAA